MPREKLAKEESRVEVEESLRQLHYTVIWIWLKINLLLLYRCLLNIYYRYNLAEKAEKYNMKNILDINIEDSFVSECWTFYKSCIIGSYSDGRKWMSTHMEVYLDGG